MPITRSNLARQNSEALVVELQCDESHWLDGSLQSFRYRPRKCSPDSDKAALFGIQQWTKVIMMFVPNAKGMCQFDERIATRKNHARHPEAFDFFPCLNEAEINIISYDGFHDFEQKNDETSCMLCRLRQSGCSHPEKLDLPASCAQTRMLP
jgi:hypothetical protein